MAVSVRSGQLQEFHFKLQGSLWWDHATCAARTVSEVWRNNQCAASTHAHASHTFVPALNDCPGTQFEDEGCAPVFTGVELGALHAVLKKPAGVMNADALPMGGGITSAFDGVFELES